MHSNGFIKPYQSQLDTLYRLSDAIIIFLCYSIAANGWIHDWNDNDTLICLVASVLFTVVASYNDLYRSWRLGTAHTELFKVLVSWSIAVLLLLACYSLGLLTPDIRGNASLWLTIVPVALVLKRGIMRYALRKVRAHKRNTRKTAILGVTSIGKELAKNIKNSPWTGLELKGYYDDRNIEDGRVEDVHPNEIAGDTSDLIEEAKNGDIDIIFLALPLRAEQRIRHQIEQLSDTTASVYISQDYRTYDLLHGRWFNLGSVPVVSIHETPILGVESWMKRLEDILLALIAIVVFMIPAIMITIAIKATSAGPVVFKQKRYGLDGREFKIWKFRTMTVCEDGDKINQACKNDPRITRIGNFLRATSLDEIPQFINVLIGNMSIVGPRPHAIAHNETYRKLIPSYMLRHKVKPGITGLAQVNGFRGETKALSDMEKRVLYDLDYIRNWSLLLDIKIIMKTSFTGKKAY